MTSNFATLRIHARANMPGTFAPSEVFTFGPLQTTNKLMAPLIIFLESMMHQTLLQIPIDEIFNEPIFKG